MSDCFNFVRQAVSGTPGTGTITLGAAAAGWLSLATAAGRNAVVDLLYQDGLAQGCERDCIYNHAAGTITRGIHESSTTGARLSLTSAAVVSVVETAATGNAVANQLSRTRRSEVLADGSAPIFHWGGAPILPAQWSVESGSPTITVETRNGRPCLKIVTASNVTGAVGLFFAGDVAWYGRALFQVEGSRAGSNVSAIVTLLTGDGFTNYVQGTYTTQTNPNQQSLEPAPLFTFMMTGQSPGAPSGPEQEYVGFGASWGTTNPPLDGTTIMTRVRMLVFPTAGQSATLYVYGVSLSPPRRTGRIFVTCDDGYKSAVNLILPIFAARRIPVTFDTIGQLVNDTTNGYLSWPDARQVVASGGQVVAHGPTQGSANGNLIANHATNAARIVDMEQSRNYIADNGAASPGFDQVYVWPQGQFQASTGDTSLLDAAIAAGFTVGRAANGFSGLRFDFSALSKYQRLALPIIGHVYAGGGEAANIATINAAITATAAAGTDCILMLHRGFKNADTPDSVGIRSSDLISIANTIESEVTAKRLAAGVLGDLAEPSEWAR